MTYAQIQTLTTTLLNGFSLGETDFANLVHLAQTKLETAREWEILKKLDTSLTFSASDTYLTEKSLPTDFLQFVSDRPVKLIDSNGYAVDCFEIPYQARNNYKNDFGKFYINHRTQKISFCGSAGQTYTIGLWYLYKPTEISTSQEWVFPSWSHPILAYDVAINYKSGIDYDFVSESQARNNQEQYDILFKRLDDWNNRMVLNSLDGVDRTSYERPPFIANSINIYR